MSRAKGSQPRTVPLGVRIPQHLRDRLDDYAQRFGISLTDATILALYRGFGDQRGIQLRRRHPDGTATVAAPRREQQPARRDPAEPLPDPFEAS